MNLFHDKSITRKHFELGQRVLLYSWRLELFPGKLWSRWIGPFFVIKTFDHGAVDVQSEKIGQIFKVNWYHLKPFDEGFNANGLEIIYLDVPMCWSRLGRRLAINVKEWHFWKALCFHLFPNPINHFEKSFWDFQKIKCLKGFTFHSRFDQNVFQNFETGPYGDHFALNQVFGKSF